MIAYSGENCLQYYDRNIVVKATPRLALSAAGPDVCDNAAPFVPRFGRELSGISGTRTYAGDGISSTGLFDPSLIPPGDHLVRYTFAAENGCSAFSDYNVTILAAPRVSAGPDLSVTGGNQVVLRGTATGNNVVLTWSPATWLNNAETAMPTASPADNIIYTLTGVSSDGCRASDDVSVQVLKMPQIPNVFTPNGDGRNDRWEIPFLDRYSGCTVEIYNRYGQLLFRSVGYGSPWDGTFNSKPAPAGTYYYVINPGNGVKQISGFVDIIR